MRRLSARDAGYVYLVDGFISSRVVSCWVLARPDGQPTGLDGGSIVDLLCDRLSVDDMFSAVLRRTPGDVGEPYWVVDPDSDPTRHIRVLPDRMTWPQAQALIADEADRPFDTTAPLWSIDVLSDVTGIPGQGGSATILSVSFHHAAFDGIGWEERMHRLLADEPDRPADPIPIGPLEGPWWRTVARDVLRAPARWVAFVVALVRALLEARRAARRPQSDRAVYDRRAAPVTRFNRGLRGRRWTDFLELDQDDLTRIARLVPSATENDVLLSMVAGAVRAYLELHDESPPRSLVCLVPMSTRRWESGGSDTDTANKFLPLSVSLHTDIDDVVERIAATAQSTRSEKDRATAVVTSSFWRAVKLAPALALRISGAVARRRGHRATSSTAVNTVLSTIVSTTPVATVADVPVVSGFGVSPLGNETTLAHCAVVGLGRVRLCVTADDEVLPDMTTYMRLLRTSIDDHLRAAAEVSGGRVQ
ncbi:wax ester/triacylglycerol synthase domain-containing protein [Williamsia deligens]|uniref:diacylglycerol O-acyltransferase n=1 Tax=Williamsia deligens TaxID=321325 RepID=A0ABW3G1P4_9NOCA|nr:wax ester/triacylglycerol synthase domain-containing protein [Williamsia deligens]MCP2194700.1 acyltransferase, WS/DGAT/MGAT [Williamsia deligens]